MTMTSINASTKQATIVLGGGCFWCLEAAFQMIKGVRQVTPGYAGGQTKNPTYWQVVGGTTGHAEVVQVEFDPTIVSLKDTLDVFWTIHDPTTLNRQDYDVGTEYRSIILYTSSEQRTAAEKSIKATQKLWDDPIVTELAPLEHFYPAEAEHHNYFRDHPERAYCQIIINPKLQKLRKKLAQKMKS